MVFSRSELAGPDEVMFDIVCAQLVSYNLFQYFTGAF